MIPKVIHYCWFGKKRLPIPYKKCIKSWKYYCPNYKIVQWNERNFDLSRAPLYVKEAYKVKKWAFVTDYVRLYIIYNYGGVYLDTDVELIKPLDKLLSYDSFFGFEDFIFDKKILMSTGLGFGSIPKNPLLKRMMDDYDNAHFIVDNKLDLTPCTQRNSHVLEDFGFSLNGKTQIIGNLCLLSPEYLCPIKWNTKEVNITGNTISIHWFSASWENNKKITLKAIIKRIIGGKLYFNIKKLLKK